MIESPTASVLKIVERDLSRSLKRVSALNDLVAQAADRIEEIDPPYARELRRRAFEMAFLDRRGPRGTSW
jgi:hypothetical protein